MCLDVRRGAGGDARRSGRVAGVSARGSPLDFARGMPTDPSTDRITGPSKGGLHVHPSTPSASSGQAGRRDSTWVSLGNQTGSVGYPGFQHERRAHACMDWASPCPVSWSSTQRAALTANRSADSSARRSAGFRNAGAGPWTDRCCPWPKSSALASPPDRRRQKTGCCARNRS